MKIIKIGAIWCPGCLVMKKIWKNIKANYPDLELEELDLDMDSETVKKYNPGKVLPIHIFLDSRGMEIERITGEVSEEVLVDKINKYK